MVEYLQATMLGIVKGLTEFLPVSSTGHLLLLGYFMDVDSPTKAFEVLVHLGAILALLVVYAHQLFRIAKALPSSPEARRFLFGVLVAFLPAMFFGVLLYPFFQRVLFNPYVVCLTLIGGGLILLVIDEHSLEAKYTDATRFPLTVYAKIGLIQCLAMVPGVSRSSAAIVGGLLLGADKRSAAEFSFFLAIPTMAGILAYDIMKNYHNLSFSDGGEIVVGFAFAFIAGYGVVRSFLSYISRHGFAPFAWWRIVIGAVGLAALLTFG